MNILPILNHGSLVVVCGPHAASEQASILIAQLALRSPVNVLDFGNRFRPYETARVLRQSTADVNRFSKRIFIRRAFTCFQVQALLENTPSLQQPYVILDLLASFEDENVDLRQVSYVLDKCLVQIGRLRQRAPLVLTIRLPSKTPGRDNFINLVREQADRVLTLEEEFSQVHQPALFQ